MLNRLERLSDEAVRELSIAATTFAVNIAYPGTRGRFLCVMDEAQELHEIRLEDGDSAPLDSISVVEVCPR
jgi:hypothetical protein